MKNIFLIAPLEQERKHTYKLYFCFTVACLILVGVVIYILTTFILPYDDNIVEVIGYDDFKNNIPASIKKSFSTQLYNQLKMNFEVPYRRGAVKAIIRPETYVENTNISTTGSFIADIDEYQQTFQVSLVWSYNDIFIPENVVLSCTKKTQAKYPDAMCYGMYTTSDSISLYLPYETTLDSGAKVVLQYDFIDNDGIQNLKILVDNCGSQSIKDAALNMMKEYIDGLGDFKASDYVINVPSIYNNCMVK